MFTLEYGYIFIHFLTTYSNSSKLFQSVQDPDFAEVLTDLNSRELFWLSRGQLEIAVATEGQDPRQISGFITGRKSCDSKCPRNHTTLHRGNQSFLFYFMSLFTLFQRGGNKLGRFNTYRCCKNVFCVLDSLLFLSFSSINTCSLYFCLHPFKSYRWGETMFIDLLFDLVAHQDCVCMSVYVCLYLCV